MKHNRRYGFYIVKQDLINFLRGDAPYDKRPSDTIDTNIYSHFGDTKKHLDKHIGIIIEHQNSLYFAPITHDGNKNWFHREDTCDFETIYNSSGKYLGSVLLCKALPLTSNCVQQISINEIKEKDGEQYANLCFNEIIYLNSSNIHDKIQNKMQKCIYGHQTSCMHLRVDYQLIAKNVIEYNKLQEQKKSSILDKTESA